MKTIFFIILGFVVENGFFEFAHRYYCRKNKGKCENCKDWSCPRQEYINEKNEKKGAH